MRNSLNRRITQIRLDRKWVKGGYRELDQKSPPFIKGDLGLPAIGFAFRRGGRGDFETVRKSLPSYVFGTPVTYLFAA